MKIGIDIGYSAVKIVAGNRRATFPSVVGSPDQARLVLGEQDNAQLTMPSGNKVLVGAGAITQSQFLNRREDRDWIRSPEYHALMLMAFTEITSATRVDLDIVTGLPIAFYSSDKNTLKEIFVGGHKVTRGTRGAQVFRVNSCRVVPQPFGSLFASAMDAHGRITDQKWMEHTGIIDIGGKTTNLLSTRQLGEIGFETASVNVGTWNAVRALRTWMNDHCPEIDMRDHEIVEAITTRQMKYYGELISLDEPVNMIIERMATRIISEATKLWNGAASFDAILVTGGGAHLLGTRIEEHFRHAQIVKSPVEANAEGFWKYAQRF